MARCKVGNSSRFRVGRVTVYEYHGAWWVYYRDGGSSSRRRVADDRASAETVAAQVNSQLARREPTLLAFTPIAVADLRQRFLDYHEKVLHSSIGTVRRYRAATQHLETFSQGTAGARHAHEVSPEAFAAWLRVVEVAPNGHPNTARRKLRSKGVQFVLEACRSLFNYAMRQRHLPPYAGNPFSVLPIDRVKLEDSNPSTSSTPPARSRS